MSLHVRQAVLGDADILYHWDEKPHVKKAVSNDGTTSFEADWEDELASQDDSMEFLIAELDGRPIGAMQIINPATEPSHYWGHDVPPNLRAMDIWIGEEAYLGQGHGAQMMTFAINRCFAEAEVEAILIDPLANNQDAHRFYKRLGFVFVEQRQFDEDSDCFVFRLNREAWELRGNK